MSYLKPNINIDHSNPTSISISKSKSTQINELNIETICLWSQSQTENITHYVSISMASKSEPKPTIINATLCCHKSSAHSITFDVTLRTPFLCFSSFGDKNDFTNDITQQYRDSTQLWAPISDSFTHSLYSPPNQWRNFKFKLVSNVFHQSNTENTSIFSRVFSKLFSTQSSQ